MVMVELGRSGSSALEKPIGIEGPKRESFGALWTNGAERFKTSRNEILDALALENGELYLASPDAVINETTREVVEDPYARRLPQRWLLPMMMEQEIANEIPDYLREALGGSDRQNIAAQKTEAWLRAVRSERLPWVDGVGKMVRAGQFAAFMLPSSAAWERRPSYMDTQSNEIRKQWWRSADNAPTPDRSKLSRTHSAKAYRAALERFQAGEVPFAYRLVSATDCVPFFRRGNGRNRWELTALLVRSLYDKETLIADGYLCEGLETLLIPRGYSEKDTRGAYGQVYLYEYLYYALDEETDDRIPMLAYSVAGLPTWNRRFSAEKADRAEAVINLRERYGMRSHRMGYYWGWRRAGEDDPGRMGIPHMLPFMDLILGTESLISSTEKHARASAFCGYQYVLPKDAAYTPTPALPGAASPHGDPPQLPGSGEAIATEGEFQPIAPAPIGDEVRYLIELGLAQLQASTPDPQLSGGEGSGSGHKLSLLDALQKVANNHYREGGRLWVEDFGTWALETACELIEHFKLESLPVQANLPPQIDAKGSRSPREMLALTTSMVGGRYHVTAYYPEVGSIPDVQQISELFDKRQASWDDLMEARGKTDPLGELVKITAHWLLTQTPQGQQDLMVWVARYRGDEEQAKTLIEQGMMTEDGSTTAEILPEAQQAAEGAVMQLPQYAQNSLAGTLSGAMESAPIQADGIATSEIPVAQAVQA